MPNSLFGEAVHRLSKKEGSCHIQSQAKEKGLEIHWSVRSRVFQQNDELLKDCFDLVEIVAPCAHELAPQ
jgi:hypothetical protein